jgi:hypothetical protein
MGHYLCSDGCPASSLLSAILSRNLANNSITAVVRKCSGRSRACQLSSKHCAESMERPVGGWESHPLDINTFHGAQFFDPTAFRPWKSSCHTVSAFLHRKRTTSESVSRWAIEECCEQSKQETGLDEYEVRSWHAWYRHITLSMSAHAMLGAIRRQANSKISKKGARGYRLRCRKFAGC